jgi:two-component system response regulator GlrR
MTHIMDRINKFSKSDSHVLITGESGVGKGLVAREVHEISGRSRGPFVQVNAGAIPATLFEAELFGVKKGAYTGAGESRDGLFQAADGGTLFLDEIAEVPPEAQAKLLRVLDSGEVRSVGDTRTKKINVRIIAATNQNLDEMVENKSFRKDLFYRLSNLVLDVPPLRERTEDIPLLADYFLKQTQKRGETSRRLSTGALKWLMRQKWLGNVRELKNVLERAVLLSDQDVIKAEDLTEQTVEETPGRMGVFRQAKRRQVEIFEKNYVRDLLKECSGNVSKAAMKAGLARRNFQLMIKKYNMKAAQYRKNL